MSVFARKALRNDRIKKGKGRHFFNEEDRLYQPGTLDSAPPKMSKTYQFVCGKKPSTSQRKSASSVPSCDFIEEDHVCKNTVSNSADQSIAGSNISLPDNCLQLRNPDLEIKGRRKNVQERLLTDRDVNDLCFSDIEHSINNLDESSEMRRSKSESDVDTSSGSAEKSLLLDDTDSWNDGRHIRGGKCLKCYNGEVDSRVVCTAL